MICEDLSRIIYSRYGLEYLTSIMRGYTDEDGQSDGPLDVGAWKIDLDNLIYQKQRALNQDRAAFISRSMFNKQSPTKVRSEFGDLGNPEYSTQHIINPYYKEEQNENLAFDSIFESGNLAVAQKVSDQEYNLVLQNDVNTLGHTQWFFFRVKTNFKNKTTVRFHMLNLLKPRSLYEEGLKVLVLDCKGYDFDQAIFGAEDKYLPRWR